MECPICSEKNTASATHCRLCNTQLRNFSDTIFATETTPSRLRITRFFSLKIWGLLFSVILIASIAWTFVWNRDLLNTPSEVKQSEKKYLSILTNYQKDREMWIDRKNQVLHIMKRYGHDENVPSRGLDFNHVPLEIFLAFLDDNLDFFRLFSSEVALFPNVYKEHTSFFLVKKQSRFFFFPSYLTLEIDLHFDGPNMRTHWVSARQGKHSIPIEEGLNHFSRELRSLRALQEYAPGMKTLAWTAKDSPQRHKETSQLFSFEYQKKSLL